MKKIDSIQLAKEKLGLSNFENLNFKFKKFNNGKTLRIEKNGNEVTITYSEDVMLFRGLTVIKEHAGENKFDITFNKHFDHNGFMIDCSRNGVANIENLKNIILIQALMGRNRLLLYTEDTYKLDKYPFFGYLRGGYSKGEIKEIVAYAEEFGIELVPCIQTLGHLERPLQWEPMIPLRDGPSTLLAGDEKVYEFIEEMIKFSRECFKSKDIHIGMDESTEMGLGRYLQEHKYTDRIELFSKHLDKVIDICKKYDFEPMIWSDMFFRLNAKDEEYYRDTPLPESTLKLIPKDINLVYWDYYHDDIKVYDDMFSYHKQTNRSIVFAGGAWRWKGYTPSIQGSFNNSIPAVTSCLKNGIKSVFITAWGDNGSECSLCSTLPIQALYSVADYTGSTNDDAINSLLIAITGDTLEDFKLMDLPDRPAGKVLAPMYNPSRFFLFQDPLNGIFDLQVKDGFAETYKKNAKLLSAKAKTSRNFGYAYDVLSALCNVLEIKVDLGVRLRKSYKEDDKSELKRIAKKEIPELISRLDVLNAKHYIQWNKENTPFGYDVVDGRIGYLKNRLITTKNVVEEYLSGKIEKIEELETEILPFNGHDCEISWHWWIRTVTVHCI